MAFELIQRHHLGQVGIGVFALVGAAGASAAPLAGLARVTAATATSAAASPSVLAVAAMILAGLGAGNLILLALAGVLLDFAVQSHQVFGQREIYELRGDARARVNTIYMTAIFLGGSVATAISGTMYDGEGWFGVAMLGAGLAFASLCIWTVAALRRPRAAVTVA